MSIRKLKARGIGRLELLAWLNEFLETDYTKIEHLADGIAYCQVFDALYPGKVGLQHVIFRPKGPTDYERNFRVLRKALHVCDIRKEVPVRKLVEGIFQEHFEFLHWVHDYVHRTYPDVLKSYHGFERRQQVLGSELSLAQINSANTNLVPKFSNSMTLLRRESLLENLDIQGIMSSEDNAAIHPTSCGDTEAKECSELTTSSGATCDDKLPAQAASLHPSLEFVRHSFKSTLRAATSVEQASRTIAEVQSGGGGKTGSGKSSTTRVKPQKSPTARKLRALSASRGAAMDVAEYDENGAADPFMCMRLSDLIEALEAELYGRVDDMKHLEHTIEVLRTQ